MLPKYPRTRYWPGSPSVESDHRIINDPTKFIGVDLVITEKLDGGNVLLHSGDVYARSTSMGTANSHPWFAMVRKHHAWKLATVDDVLLYGEDLFGVHSIKYDAMYEEDTFRVFATTDIEQRFSSFNDTVMLAVKLGIQIVPVLYEGQFKTLLSLQDFLEKVHKEESALGGEREGVVIRLAGSFSAEEFQESVCKSVRKNHVQTDEHWTRNWQSCKLKER